MTAAGIVTFNPDLDCFLENLAALVKQCDDIVIVDNKSGNIQEIEQVIQRYPQITLIKNDHNMGVAYALNQIVKHAGNAGYPWVLLLDQDSVIGDNLFAVYHRYIDFDRVAILTPRIVDRTDTMPEQAAGEPYEIIRKGITSGSYVNIPICEHLGCFDEAMFIDYVDFEYCYRVRQAGFVMLQCNETILLHQLGAIEWVKLFGHRIEVTNHSANRCYFVARNAEYCLLKHKGYLSRRNEYKKLLQKAWKIVLFEKDKSSKITAMCKGILDGRKLYRQTIR